MVKKESPKSPGLRKSESASNECLGDHMRVFDVRGANVF